MTANRDLDLGEWVDKQVFLPKGHEFGKSKTPHLDSALTFVKGQKGTHGPTVMRDPMPSRMDKISEARLPANSDPRTTVAIGAFALGVVATVVAVKNRHRIKTWWEAQVLPKLLSGTPRALDVDPNDLEAASVEIDPNPMSEETHAVFVGISGGGKFEDGVCHPLDAESIERASWASDDEGPGEALV